MHIITVVGMYIAAVIAGFIGSLLGLGGGIIMVPVLDIVFNFDIKAAAATSIIGVVGTSMISSSTYIDKKITNIKLALTLTISSIFGSFIGMYTIINLESGFIRVLFGLLLAYSAYYILKKQELGKKGVLRKVEEAKSWEEKLSSGYYDEAEGAFVEYDVKSVKIAMVLMFLSGFSASLFGVGGGVVNVPVLAIVVGVPLKVAVATSTLIILFSATTSSLLQLKFGYTVPWAAGTLFLGTITGARVGSKIMNKLPTNIIKKGASLAFLYTAIKMILKGLGIPSPI
ncbi:MAG: sulfite exporter TauE/SafE family protein [Candidatus Njordarchaeia archaeon]